jgi:hypothetical protein
VRLYLHRQLITIMPPAGTAAGVPEQIQIRAPAVQVLAMSGVRLDGVAKDEADLHRGATLTDITVSAGGDSGLDWLAGLRGLGGVTIPVVDGFFSRLGNLFDYAVLLWALVSIRFALPYSRLAEVSRNIVFTIIAAMGAVAFLAFLIDLGTALFHSLNPRGEAAAGPVALLVAGAGLVWPVACFRTGRDRRPRHRPLARPYVVWFTCAIYGLVLFEYWVILYAGMHINLLTNVHAFAGTVLVTALVWLLVRKLLGTVGLAPALVSAGVLIVALGATIIWPVLYFSSWGPAWDNYIAHVNVWGKWIFLAVAVLAVLGLGLLVFRAVQALPIARRWRITLTLAITVMITAIVLPDAITNAQLAEPHGSSLAPINLIGLFDTLPLLVDWLLLALAIAVAMSLPAKSAARPLARRIVIPIALLLLFWNDKWLYLPVTLIIGLILLSRLVFPRRLAEVMPYTQTSAEAIDESIASWRQADFVARQRQALTSGTGPLADLIQNENSDYTKRIESLTEIQDQLACERDRLQSNARKLEAVAFEQRGWVPDRRTAVSGAVLGAILGVVPSLITILTTKPSVSSSGYPALNFFGGTAWSFLEWIGIGWLVGYSLPIMRGRNGSEKALWLFLTGIGAMLPMQIIWDDSSDWTQTLIWSLELIFFLMLTAIYLCDLRILHRAGKRLTDWFTVQNWHFVVTWSTALLAALGTAMVTFLSTAATDLSNQAFNGTAGPSTSTTSQNSTSQVANQNSVNQASTVTGSGPSTP